MNNRKEEDTIALVVPCYDEEQVILESCSQLNEVVDSLISKNKISKESFILLVDDGSKDKTWELISKLAKENGRVKGLKLAHNVGHQNALLAGLMYAKEKSDCAVSVDADLQDDISAIEQFVDKYLDGYDIVYGVRNNRKSDTFFKRSTAQFFYKLMKMMGVDIIYNHGDYRLVARKVLDGLEKFDESNLFLRGIFPIIGFKSTKIYFSRKERLAGKSKYPLTKMLSFAFDGITSFSIKPLRAISVLGFLIFLGSLIASIWILIEFFSDKTIHGWASTVLPLYLMGGIQLLSLGMIGEYIGKIYKETKHRPRYFIEEEIG